MISTKPSGKKYIECIRFIRHGLVERLEYTTIETIVEMICSMTACRNTAQFKILVFISFDDIQLVNLVVRSIFFPLTVSVITRSLMLPDGTSILMNGNATSFDITQSIDGKFVLKLSKKQ